MSRPPFHFDAKVVKDLAGQGLNQVQIGNCLGWSVDTVRRYRRRFATFSKAFDEGRAEGIVKVTRCLMDKVEAGDTNAMKLYLYNTAGWSDRVKADTAMNVKITREIVRNESSTQT